MVVCVGGGGGGLVTQLKDKGRKKNHGIEPQYDKEIKGVSKIEIKQ